MSKIEADWNRVEFTRCVLEKNNNSADSERLGEDGEWLSLEIKRIFDTRLVTSHGHDLTTVLGFRLNPDEGAITSVRLRLGFFETCVGEILHRAIAEMKLGELAQISFELDPRLLLDESSTAPAIDQVVFIDLKFEIRLVDIDVSTDHARTHRPIYLLDANQLMERGFEHKNDANRLFKLGRVGTAFRRYKKSIDYFIIAKQWVQDKIKTFNEMAEEGSMNLSELNECKQKIETARAQIFSNMALCQIKTKKYELAVKNCQKCLAIEPKNVKALFRCGQARTGLKDYDEAAVDFRRALEIESDNQDVLKYLANCERLKKEYEKDLAANLKKMFT